MLLCDSAVDVVPSLLLFPAILMAGCGAMLPLIPPSEFPKPAHTATPLLTPIMAIPVATMATATAAIRITGMATATPGWVLVTGAAGAGVGAAGVVGVAGTAMAGVAGAVAAGATTAIVEATVTVVTAIEAAMAAVTATGAATAVATLIGAVATGAVAASAAVEEEVVVASMAEVVAASTVVVAASMAAVEVAAAEPRLDRPGRLRFLVSQSRPAPRKITAASWSRLRADAWSVDEGILASFAGREKAGESKAVGMAQIDQASSFVGPPNHPRRRRLLGRPSLALPQASLCAEKGSASGVDAESGCSHPTESSAGFCGISSVPERRALLALPSRRRSGRQTPPPAAPSRRRML